MMNRRYLAYCAIALAITLVCVILLLMCGNGGTLIHKPISGVTNPVSLSSSSSSSYGLSVSKATPSPIPPLSIGQVLAPVFETPIEFYGRVLDDKNIPITTVSVEFKPVTAYSIGENSTDTGLYTTTSDSNGNFAIKNLHGAQLYVKVQKSGYLPLEQDGNVKSIGFGVVGGHSIEGGRDPDHPVIFYLKPVLSKEPVLRGNFDVSFEYSQLRGTCDVATVNSLGTVQCLMTAQYQTDNVPQFFTTPHNWSLTLKIPGGGFLPLDDPESQLAPTSSYEETEVISMPVSDKQWSWRADKYYYVKLPGDYFGKIKISVFTSDAKQPYFTILYTVNPKKGSPYLSADSQDSQTPAGY